MALGDLNRRDYMIGGAILGLVILFLVLGLSLSAFLFFGALAFSAGYVFLRNERELEDDAHGLEVEDSFQTSTDTDLPEESRRRNTRKWKVTIGREHTPSSSIVRSPEGSMDRSIFGKGRLGTSLLQSPSSPSMGRRSSLGLSPGPGSGMNRLSIGSSPLPRVRRISKREGGSILYSPDAGRSPMASPGARRYPTHQPQYSGVGMMPPVQLKRPKKPVLGEHNSSMLSSPVTVKVAPPDHLRPPVPSVVHVPDKPAPTPPEPTPDPRATVNVLSAIREKRKRTIRDDDDDDDADILPTHDEQDNKRRRQAPTSPVPRAQSYSESASDRGHVQMEVSSRSLKRPALSRYREDPILMSEGGESSGKRVRSQGPSLSPPQVPAGITGRVRNPIEVSYSSSKRWLEKKKQAGKDESLNASRDQTRSRSREPGGKKLAAPPDDGEENGEPLHEDSPFKGLPPRRILSLVDQDTPMKDVAKGTTDNGEPMPSTSGTADGADTPDITYPENKKRLFPLVRDSSSKRRHTPIRGDSNTEFSKVPTLRYTLTTEDYEKDRASDMERVEAMLEEVEEAHAAKIAAKSDTSSKTSAVSSGVNPAVTSTISTTATTSKPPSITSTTTATTLPTTQTPASTNLSTTTTTNPLLQKNLFPSQPGAAPAAAAAKPLSVTSPLGLSKTTTSDCGTAIVSSGLGTLTSPGSLGTITGKPASATATSSSVTSVLFHHSPTVSAAPSAVPSAASGGLGAPPSYAASVSSSPAVATSAAPASTQYSFNPVFKAQGSTAAAPTAASASATLTAAQSNGPPAAPAPTSTFSFGGKPATSSQNPAQAGAMNNASTGGFSFGAGSTAAPAAKPGTFDFGSKSTATSGTSNPTAGSALGANSGFTFGAATTQAGTGTTNAGSTTGFTFGGANFASANATNTASAAPSFGNTTQKSVFGASTNTVSTTAPNATSASTGGFNFGAAASKPATAGSSVFGGPSASPAFGDKPAATSTAPNTGFQFNAATPQKSAPSVFGQTGQSTPSGSATPAFGSGISTTSNASVAFGQQVSSTTSVFGQPKTNSAPTTAFGSTPAPAGGSVFGGTGSGAGTGNTGFQFGNTAQATPQMSFPGNQAPSQATTTGQTSAFTFGASKPAAAAKPGGVITFGQPAGSTTTNATSTFSSTATNAFATNTPTNFAFGSSGSTQNAFGGSAATTQSQGFGTPSNSGTVFGGGQAAASGGFGTTSSQPSKGFDFSAAAKPNMNFGQPAQPQGNVGFGTPTTQNSSIAFGNPSSSASFAFNGAGSSTFGSAAPGTPQSGTSTPLFGTPTQQPGGPPAGGFSPAGAFNLGSGNTQARPRPVVRANRRRANRR